jgi:hypothetical protein
MAYYPHDLEGSVDASKLNVAVEELELSSFGESLVPVEIVDVINRGMVLESKIEFPAGMFLRIDFCPVTGNGRDKAIDEVVMFGCVKECREVIEGRVYRIYVVFKRLKNDKFDDIVEEVRAV